MELLTLIVSFLPFLNVGVKNQSTQCCTGGLIRWNSFIRAWRFDSFVIFKDLEKLETQAGSFRQRLSSPTLTVSMFLTGVQRNLTETNRTPLFHKCWANAQLCGRWTAETYQLQVHTDVRCVDCMVSELAQRDERQELTGDRNVLASVIHCWIASAIQKVSRAFRSECISITNEVLLLIPLCNLYT